MIFADEVGKRNDEWSIYGAYNPNTDAFITIENRNCVFP